MDKVNYYHLFQLSRTDNCQRRTFGTRKVTGAIISSIKSYLVLSHTKWFVIYYSYSELASRKLNDTTGMIKKS